MELARATAVQRRRKSVENCLKALVDDKAEKLRRSKCRLGLASAPHKKCSVLLEKLKRDYETSLADRSKGITSFFFNPNEDLKEFGVTPISVSDDYGPESELKKDWIYCWGRLAQLAGEKEGVV